MSSNNSSDPTPADTIRDIRYSGIKSTNTDGESVTFMDPSDLAKLQTELEQSDPTAIACGRVRPRLATIKFHGIY